MRKIATAGDDDEATTTNVIGRPSMRPPSSKPGALDADQLVHDVKKREGAAFAARIGVGRTRATDVWLPFPDVSKYHAYFERDEVTGRYSLTDASSKNGTIVAGKRLNPLAPYFLDDTALLSFGGCEARFCTPSAFYHFLGKYF